MAPKTWSSDVDRLLLNLERDIMADVVRRLKAGKGITSTSDWQLSRMAMLGNSSSDIRNMLQTAAGATTAEMSKIYSQAAQEAYTRDSRLYTAVGKNQVPYMHNEALQQLVKSVGRQADDVARMLGYSGASSVRNLTGSTGFMLKDKNGRLAYTPAAMAYQQIMDRSMVAVASGAFDYNSMIRKAVKELTASGLRTIDYDSGRSVRLDVAVRRAILTGYGQITSKVSFMNAEQLGTDLFEVSWHPNARPDHQAWQGRVYTRKQLETVCGYGSVGGLCGANCRHVFYPFIKGISDRQYSDEDLRRLDFEENAPKEFMGKEYTDYEATQEQRRLETAMRAYYEQAELLEMAETDEEDITLVTARLQAMKQRYKALSKFFGLPEQWERVMDAA